MAPPPHFKHVAIAAPDREGYHDVLNDAGPYSPWVRAGLEHQNGRARLSRRTTARKVKAMERRRPGRSGEIPPRLELSSPTSLHFPQLAPSRSAAICRLFLVAVTAALLLAACGADQDTPYDHGCAFTAGCGPPG